MTYETYWEAANAAENLSIEYKDEKVYINHYLGQWDVRFYPEEQCQDYFLNGDFTDWDTNDNNK